MMRFAEIVVNVPVSTAHPFIRTGETVPPRYAWLDQAFTYQVPPPLRDTIRVGQMVWVPFGARRLQGIVVRLSDTTPIEQTRLIEEIVDTRPLLSEMQLQLARWISHRYLSPLPECVWLMLPPGIEEKVETTYERVAGRLPPDDLTERQRELWELTAARGGIKSQRLTPALRAAAESLVQQGLLTKQARIKPPLAKPKRVQAVRLVAPPELIRQKLPTLGRPDTRSEIVDALARSEAPRDLEELCAEVGCKSAAVRALAKAGIVEIAGPQTAFRLTPLYYETLPALAPTPARALVYLREQGGTASFDELYDATHVSPSTLRDLEGRGLIERIERAEQVRLIGAPRRMRQPSPLARIVEFLEREPGPVWISAVYAATGASLQDLRKLERAGIVQLESEELLRDPLDGHIFAPQPRPELTAEQARAFERIRQGLDSGCACAYLLHGVTGSGKTEIYLRAIEEVIRRGKQAIALVPEIALTPQTIQRFGARFGGRIGVIHSELSYGERYDTWRRARDGKLDVVIGPRSALFAPLPHLGLIVMDEEHEPSYKQEGDIGIHLPLYHSREVALELARQVGASVICGSATPDVQTHWRAQMGEFELLELPQRILAHGSPGEPARYQDLPPVEIVDLRAELRAGNTLIFSRALASALREVYAAHEQAILFLNRRGTATAMVCRDCGQAVRCPRCNNPYTLHQQGGEQAGELVCHHCGRRSRIPRVCPSCGSARIRGFGLGTEKLEQAVREQFPGVRTLRWDWDVTRGRESHEKILEAFTHGEADVLIGTQMIAKGLDLPRVTLVGVVNADTGLNLPDFRAGERTFQLLTQVAGRAGRSALRGRVIIQTFFPEHYAITCAARHDYAGFCERELRFRQEAGYPPFRPLIRLLYTSTSEADASAAAAQFAAELKDRIRRQALPDVELIGPAPAFYAKLGGRYRYHLLLRGQNAAELLETIPPRPGWRVDVDPINML